MIDGERFVWTDDMDELSGFGGEYERLMREMLHAGLLWLSAHPSAEPKFTEHCLPLNDDAEQIYALMDQVSKHEMTPLVYGSVIIAMVYVREHGWPAFVSLMKRRKASAGT